jgi:hypothetical protein
MDDEYLEKLKNLDFSKINCKFNMEPKIKIRNGTVLEPLGIGMSDGKLIPLVEEGSKLPVELKYEFRTTTDNQESIEFEIFQGNGIRTRDCILVGFCKISGLPPVKEGDLGIRVGFKIDEQGFFSYGMGFGAGYSRSIDFSEENGDRIVLSKDGEILEYSSIHEMPSDIREEYETFKAKKEIIKKGFYQDGVYNNRKHIYSHHLHGPSYLKGDGYYTNGDFGFFIYKGKEYLDVYEIDDEEARKDYLDLLDHVDEENGKPKGRNPPIQYSKPIRNIMDKSIVQEVLCSECGNQVIPIITFFGIIKCPECKAKLKKERRT